MARFNYVASLLRAASLTVAVILLSYPAFTQSRGEIDPIRCISPILTSTIQYSNSKEDALRWLNMVDENYYKEHKTEVDAKVTTAGWQAAANFDQFDAERREYHKNSDYQSSTKESVQYFFNGMNDDALKTVNHCFDAVVADGRPGLNFTVRKNTAEEVHLRINWVGLPGPNADALVVNSSTLSNATRLNVKRGSVLSRVSWNDPPNKNEIFATGLLGLKLSGSSVGTVILKRDKQDKPITGTIYGPNFDEVYFDVEPPAKPKPRVESCSVTARDLVGEGQYLTLAYPPSGIRLILDCYPLPADKNIVISWHGTLLPPQFLSYSDNKPVDNSNPAVDYVVQVNLRVLDAAGQQIVPDPILVPATPSQPAMNSRTLNGSTAPVPVPSNGEVILYLAAIVSSKWPSGLGPITLSNDFTVTVQVTQAK